MSSHIPAGPRGGTRPHDEGGGHQPRRERPVGDAPQRDEPGPDEPGGDESGRDARPAATEVPDEAPPTRRRRREVSTRDRIRTKMSSRQQVRDAFLLHEVLGPPVALREPGPQPPGG